MWGQPPSAVRGAKLRERLSHRRASPEAISASFRNLQAHFAKLSNQASCPPVHVVFAHGLAHSLHAHLFLFWLHFERRANRLRRLIDVIRIYLECIAQLSGGAGKATENQHTTLVVPGGNEFLRYQVHPIVQRSYQAKIGGTVVVLDLLVAVVPVEQHNWLPLIRLESPIDTVGLCLYFGLQVVITLDVCAAGSANLHKSKHAL